MVKQFFDNDRRELLTSFVDQHKVHKEAGTVDAFWRIVIPAYIAKFPEDDVTVVPETGPPSKTKCGKVSKKRAPGQPKPLRERIVEWYGNSRRVVPGTKQHAGISGGARAIENLLTGHSSHIKPLLDYDAYKASLATGTAPVSEFAYRNACTREAWDNAPPDIRQKVMASKKLQEMSLEELEDTSGEVGFQGGSGAVASSSDTGGPALTPVLEGEPSSGDTAINDGEKSLNDTTTSREEPGDDPEVKGPGDQATSMFNTAIRETLQIKKIEDRERAIENLYNTAIGILRGIMTHTGWVTTLLTGGPRPSLGGDLDVIVVHSGTTQTMTFEAWLKQDVFKSQVVLPFKDYLKTAFPDDTVTRKVMARGQKAPDADSGPAQSSSAQGSDSADRPANKDDIEKPTDTGVTSGQTKSTWVWSHGLMSHNRQSRDPDDDDDAEYRAGNEDDAEMGAPDTLRTKSARISKQTKQVELAQKKTGPRKGNSEGEKDVEVSQRQYPSPCPVTSNELAGNGTQTPTGAVSGISESSHVMMATEETSASKNLAPVAEADLALSTKEVDTTMQPVVDNAPPEIPIKEVIKSASVSLPRTAVSQQISTSPLSVPNVATDTARQSVPPATDDEPVDTAASTSLQSATSKDSLPQPDKEMVDIPQQPMQPPTSPDTAIAKDGHNAGRSNFQLPNTPRLLRDRTPTKTRRQSMQDDPDTTFEGDEQLGAVKATSPQLSNSRNTADALKAHTSGLNGPDIDSLLELIQKDDNFEEKSKPHREKLAEAIMAVRDASQSEDWSNLLRGVIILTICLEFPKGDEKGSKLTTHNRPHECEFWMQHRRRDYNKPPDLQGRLEEFGAEMRQWLITTMPDWRGTQWPMVRTKPEDVEDTTWEVLKRGGRNGIMLYIIALSWWLNQAHDRSSKQQAEAVVEDLAWAVGETVIELGLPVKVQEIMPMANNVPQKKRKRSGNGCQQAAKR